MGRPTRAKAGVGGSHLPPANLCPPPDPRPRSQPGVHWLPPTPTATPPSAVSLGPGTKGAPAFIWWPAGWLQQWPAGGWRRRSSPGRPARSHPLRRPRRGRPSEEHLPASPVQSGRDSLQPHPPCKTRTGHPNPARTRRTPSKMPRGFLVKRTRREAPISYRVRNPPDHLALAAHRTLAQAGGMATSPAPGQSPLRWPGTTPGPSSLERVSPAPWTLGPASAPPSPALGLAERPRPVPRREPAASVLGAFVCQLCQELYPGPLALAQHGCSRIARVEYRCHECGKVFSCPANLASHRRWHKPAGAAKENESPEKGPGPAGESGYGCGHCPKRFGRRASLAKHLALHHGGLPAASLATGPVLSDSQRLHRNLGPPGGPWPKKAF